MYGYPPNPMMPYRAPNPAGLGGAAGAAIGVAVSTIAINALRAERERQAVAEGRDGLSDQEERQLRIAGMLMNAGTATLGAYMLSRSHEEGYAAGGAALGVLLPGLIMAATGQRPKSVAGEVALHWGTPVAAAFTGGLIGSSIPRMQASVPPPMAQAA